MAFLFGRLGNKKNDIKYFKEFLPFENVNTVIEPFGGSFAVIRFCYKDDKYKKIVNDIDKYMNSIYNNPERYSEIKIYFNNLAMECKNNKGLAVYNDEFIKKFENNNIFTTELDKTLIEYWKKERVIRRIMITYQKTKIDNTDNIALMKKITFTNIDYLDVINKYKNDDKAFIFLDPPYMFSDNSHYDTQICESDMTDILVRIKEIFNNPETKCKIMLIINDLKIIRWLFDGFIKADYIKKYGISRKVEKHLIICNY